MGERGMNSIRSFATKDWEFTVTDNSKLTITLPTLGLVLIKAQKQENGAWVVWNLRETLETTATRSFANFTQLWEYLEWLVVDSALPSWGEQALEYRNALNALFRTIK